MPTAKKAIKDSIKAGKEPIVTKDEEGNEFHQRPFDIEEDTKPKQTRAARTVMAISLAGAKMFLSDGTYIMPHEEKRVPESDLKLCGDNLRRVS